MIYCPTDPLDMTVVSNPSSSPALSITYLTIICIYCLALQKSLFRNNACVRLKTVAHVWLQHKPRLSNPQSSKTAGAAHSGCSACWVWSSKMADRITTSSTRDGKLCHSYNLQSLANTRCSKTAGPVYSAQLPFVSVQAAVVTSGTMGCRRFLMSHFYSGDKVSYPWRLKRPWEALEWQLWDARQTHRDTLATGKGGDTRHRRRY